MLETVRLRLVVPAGEHLDQLAAERAGEKVTGEIRLRGHRLRVFRWPVP